MRIHRRCAINIGRDMNSEETFNNIQGNLLSKENVAIGRVAFVERKQKIN